MQAKQADFAIITMREDEFKALASRFHPIPQRGASGRNYGISQIQTKDGKNRTVALARCEEQGPQPAQQLANDMINDLSPSLLLVVGIGGGVPDTDFTLGDVVVSSRIHDFGVSAHKPGKIEWDMRGGIHPYASDIIASLALYEIQLEGWNAVDSLTVPRPDLDRTTFKAFDITQMTPEDKQRLFDGTPPEFWQQKILDTLKRHFDDPPRRSPKPLYICGSIGSSGSLTRDTAILIEWLQNARSIRAVEMEASGVFQAAQQVRKQFPVIAIRGISDIVGLKRDDRWTTYACHSAAAFTYALLTTNTQLFENLQLPSASSDSSSSKKSTSDMDMNTKFIIGFDLGDGESSIAFISVEDKIEPQVFELESGEPSIITALAKTSEDTFIGQEALFHKDVIELALNFKDKPSNFKGAWHTRRDRLRSFAEEFYRRFAEAHPKVAANAQVYIGYPSSWTEKEDTLRYLELFPPPPYGTIPAVELVPESRSALIQVRDYHHISEENLDSVLVIDIGSSTTDFTSIEHLEPKEISIGDTLGTRLIDQAIYDWLIEKHFRPSAMENRKSRDKAYLMYLCRKAKEQYFTNYRFYPQTKDTSFKRIVKEYWELLQLQDADMEAILARPIKGFPSGWKAAFRELLMLAQEQYHQLYGKPPKAVVLTGGGSYMSFTCEICQEVFAPALPILDFEPSLSVAKGLAGFGRWRYRVNQFDAQIKEFYQLDRLEQEIRKHIDPFEKAVITLFYTKTIDGVWRPLAYGLRNGTIRSDEISNFKSYFHELVSQWQSSPEGQQAIKEVINNFTNLLNPYLKTETDKICDQFHIDRGSLQLALTLRYEDILENDTALTRLMYNSFYKALEIIIKVTDHIMPVDWRLKVPEKLVNWALESEKKDRMKILNISIEQMRLNPHVRTAFVDAVRMQIKEQLEERAEKVKRLIV